jgi:hypothetical protein
MDPLTISLILLGSIATKGVQYYFQNKENNKNRKEAQSLANIQRLDDQNYIQQQNKITQNKLDLNDTKLKFSDTMNNNYIRDKNLEMNYTSNKATKSSLSELGSNFGINKNSFLLKSRITGRL